MSDRPQDDSAPGSANSSGWRSTSADEPPAAEPTAAPKEPAAGSPWRTVNKRDTASWQRVSEREEAEEPAEVAVVAAPDSVSLWRRVEGAAPAAEPADASAEAAATNKATEAEPEVLPFEAGEEAGTEAAALDLEDEEDEDSFSMSELVALASLAEAAPVMPVETAPPPKPSESPGLDPAEYARQQMERLRGGVAVAEPEPAVPPPAEETTPPELAPVEAAEPLTPEEQALAQKFRDAEAQIRALREQYRAGQISRTELQEALKQQMVLDEDEDIWWMMGVESDQWYRYEDDRWVLSTPAVLDKARAAAPEDGSTVQSRPITADQFAEMPLPKQVPVVDLDATIPGTQGLFLDPGAQPTVPVVAEPTVPVAAAATVPAAAMPTVPAVPSPYMPATTITPPSPAVPSFEDAVQAQRSQTMRTALIFGAVGLGFLLLLGACGLVLTFTYYNGLVGPYRDQIAGLASYEPVSQTARIYADDGTLIAELLGATGGDREPVPLTEVSPFMVHATLATEDPLFFENPGCSVVSLAGTFISNLFGSVTPGTSIEQQIARGLVIQTSGDTSVNPLRDIAVACEINQQYPREFLLQLYLTETYLGNQTYGPEAAGQFYFGNSARVLNIAQSALLAGMIDAPATFDPVVNREAAFARMDEVLNRMAEVGCINFRFAPYDGQPFCVSAQDLTSGQTVLDKARVEASNYSPRNQRTVYPHFVNYVQGVIEQYYGTSELYQRGFQIYTTLSPSIQNAAQQALTQGVASAASRGINTGSVLVTDPRTGAIRAMVGSPNFNDAGIDGQVNQVFTWQPPGSAIRPVIFTTALEGLTSNNVFSYMTPATVLWDVPTTFPTAPVFTPTNPNGQFGGALPLRFALATNSNVAAVKALAFTGIERFVETAQRMGVRFLPDAQFGLPSALGTNDVRLFDLQQAYSTLANNGNRVTLFPITRITDGAGNEVPLPGITPPSTTVQPQIAFLMQNMLSDNEARASVYGVNSPLNLAEFGGRVAAIGGSSDGARDLWTLGFSNSVVVGVWMGNINSTPTSGSDVTGPAPVWNTVMRVALSSSPPAQFANPGGIAQTQVCSATGAVYDPNQPYPCPGVRTEIFTSSQPPPTSGQSFIQTVQIDSWNNQRANQYCPDNIITRRVLITDDQSVGPWLASPAGAGFAASVGLTPPEITAPGGECSPSTQNPLIGISSPANGQAISGIVQISGQAAAGNFNRYQLEVSPANTSNFAIIHGPVGTPVQNGVLGQWNTTVVPNGAYDLRLTMYSSTGGLAFRTVSVIVNNVPPTPAPPIQPIVTTTPLPAEIILPFQPLPAATVGPTPTISFGP